MKQPSLLAAALLSHSSLIAAFSPLSPALRQLPSSVSKSSAHHAASSAGATSSSTPSLNPLLSQIKPSKTVEVFSLVKQMESEGQSVTSLCVGEPDFPPPPSVLEAASSAMMAGATTYTAVTGTIELRRGIADDLKKRKGTDYNPQTEIVVGNGAKQCVYQGLLSVCGADDEVIIPAPYWPSYPEMSTLVGATPVILQTSVSDGYLINPSALDECLMSHPKAKVLLLCNPSNPTGGVHSKELLMEIAKVLEKYPKVVVLADEIYERLVYADDNDNTDTEVTSFASLPNMFSRTITINGFSKSHAMTGFRLGYLAAPSPIAKAVSTLQGQITSCASSVSQAAGVAALQVEEDWFANNVEIMKRKRDYVLGELSKMKNVRVAVPPNGAFYILPDVSAYYNGDDTKLCLDLLKEKQLALVPGESFGAPGTVRISYATSMEELEVAMRKLGEFLDGCQ